MQTEKPTFSDNNYFYPYADSTYYRNETGNPNDLNQSPSVPDFEQPVDSNIEFYSEFGNSFDRQYGPQGYYNYPQHQNIYHSPYHSPYHEHYGYYPYKYPYYSYYPYYYPYPAYGYGYNLLPWLLLGAAIH